MEFERALFRIHQRGLLSEPFRQVRLYLERVLPWAFGLLVISLALLHATYVGKARCLPLALQRAGRWNETAGAPLFADDEILYLRVDEGDELSGLTLRMTVTTTALGDFPPAVDGWPRRLTSDDVDEDAIQEAASTTADVEMEAAGAEPAEAQEAQGREDRGPLLRYRFALDREIVLMKPEVFEKHGFRQRNVTLSESCLAPAGLVSGLFRAFDAYDGIVINELAYTLRSGGYLQRVDGAGEVEAWLWSSEQVLGAERRSLLEALWAKVMLLLRCVLTYALVSAMTGFFIRVAVNGSAVLMFLIAIASQSVGAPSSAVHMRLLTRSFPWIGVHVELLRSAGRPVWPLLRSHLAFLLLQSVAYMSCNLAWRFVLYRKSWPKDFEEEVFSLCSLIELFNLIFVRSTRSVAVFPKLASACVVYLHFYIFSSLYPFHSLALTSCMAACVYLMVYCLNHFEEPALRGDPFDHTTPTAAHPRAVYAPQLSPSWALESAPLWTMFYCPEPPSAFPAQAMRAISDEEYLTP